MKSINTLLTLGLLSLSAVSQAQMLYDDFEAGATAPIQYVSYGGQVVFNASNPDAGGLDTNGNSMSLTKDTQWDALYIKAVDGQNFDDVTPYLTGEATKKIGFYLYSPIENVVCKAQLRNSSMTDANTMDGVKAEFYSTATSVTNEWVYVELNWAWEPDASVSVTEVDELLILVANKGSNEGEPDGVGETFYLDNIMGPEFSYVQSTSVFDLREQVKINMMKTAGGFYQLLGNINQQPMALLNMQGQVVQQVADASTPFSMNGLRSGVYIARLTNNQAIKFIHQ